MHIGFGSNLISIAGPECVCKMVIVGNLRFEKKWQCKGEVSALA